MKARRTRSTSPDEWCQVSTSEQHHRASAATGEQTASLSLCPGEHPATRIGTSPNRASRAPGGPSGGCRARTRPRHCGHRNRGARARSTCACWPWIAGRSSSRPEANGRPSPGLAPCRPSWRSSRGDAWMDQLLDQREDALVDADAAGQRRAQAELEDDLRVRVAIHLLAPDRADLGIDRLALRPRNDLRDDDEAVARS